jgi:maltose O-acetyltransferase
MRKFLNLILIKTSNKLLKLLIKNSYDGVLFTIYEKMIANYERIIYERYRNQYEISESFGLNGSGIKFYGEGRIICGNNSYIGSLSTIQSAKNHMVKIGNNVQISHNVRIYTSTNVSDQDFSKPDKDKFIKDVIIEDFVWIGANVFINPGITIGLNSIVGANSVVTKNVQPYSIVGGVPAKIIKYKSINLNK